MFISTLMTSVALTAIFCASSATVMVSPMPTSRTTGAVGISKPCAAVGGRRHRPRLRAALLLVARADVAGDVQLLPPVARRACRRRARRGRPPADARAPAPAASPSGPLAIAGAPLVLLALAHAPRIVVAGALLGGAARVLLGRRRVSSSSTRRRFSASRRSRSRRSASARSLSRRAASSASRRRWSSSSCCTRACSSSTSRLM